VEFAASSALTPFCSQMARSKSTLLVTLPTPKLDLGEEEPCSEVADRLTETVCLQMIGDYPIGAFLNGGIDSSSRFFN
jgi:asparagine synthetase B (glutamine-hydrolysing)